MCLIFLLVLDASTTIPGSVLMGLRTHLGNFDECIEIQNVQTKTGSFDAQYCLVNVNFIMEFTSANKVTLGEDTVSSFNHSRKKRDVSKKYYTDNNIVF